MKKLFSICLLSVALNISAQTLENQLASVSYASNNIKAPILKSSSNSDDDFKQAAANNNLEYKTITDLSTTPNGYYVVSGTYGKEKNRDKALKKLKKNSLDPGVIIDVNNGVNYVYLKYYTDWKEAIEDCVNQYDGNYTEDVWILEASYEDPLKNFKEDDIIVEGLDYDQPDVQVVEAKKASTESTIKNIKQNVGELDKEETPIATVLNEDDDLDFEEPSTTISLKEIGKKSKLIQKADYYFSKMWYADAAKLYEEALLKGDDYYAADIIQKVADCYYYNTNMEKAYEWYNILYENYGKELSTDNLFKYAHALKGTGKYARSKRLMRLYDKKVKNEEVNYESLVDDKALPNEIVLDNILANVKDLELKNLSINTKNSDFSPMFLDSTQIVYASAKDSSVMNTRQYRWNDQPYLDLYAAKINKESLDVQEAIKLSKKVNTKYHEASVSFSPDNKTMYFTRNNYGKKLKRDKDGVNNLKLYISQKEGEEWQEAIELPFNSDDFSTGHPALSPDGKKLYFVSDRPGSIGETDIFVVDVLGDNTYSEPKNLGPEINTDKREMFPFFNGKKLYFASDGHTGLGGLDIFEAPYDSEEEIFEEVSNLGQPINSNLDDFAYIVNEETQEGFFSSNRAGGKGDDDIYAFKNPKVEETNNNAIAGVVTEIMTGELLPNALVMLLDENNIKIKEVVSAEDGSFIFEDLESNKKYVLKTQKSGYFDDITEVSTKDNETIIQDIALKRLDDLIAIENGIKKIKTEMIHFDFDKSYIRTDASVELDKLVAVMKEYPNMVIKIESHTDSRGSSEYNRYLSDKRAKSTRAYIIKQGISPDRIESAIGYGEDQLINECDGTVKCSEKAHFLNRRSEFIIIDM